MDSGSGSASPLRPSERLNLILCLLVAEAQRKGELMGTRFMTFKSHWEALDANRKFTDALRVEMQRKGSPAYPEIQPPVATRNQMLEDLKAGAAFTFVWLMQLLLALPDDGSLAESLTSAEISHRFGKDSHSPLRLWMPKGKKVDHQDVFIELLRYPHEDLLPYLEMDRTKLAETLKSLFAHHKISGGVGFKGKEFGVEMQKLKGLWGYANFVLSTRDKEDWKAFLHAFDEGWGIYDAIGISDEDDAETIIKKGLDLCKEWWKEIYAEGKAIVERLIADR